MTKRAVHGAWGFLLLFCAAAVWAAEPAKRSADEMATSELRKLQGLVGEWDGVGQPQRRSTRGSWKEQAQWRWDFSADTAALVYESTDGKWLTGLRLAHEPGSESLVAAATLPGSKQAVTYSVDQPDTETLVLSHSEKDTEAPQRITLRLVADGDRLVARFERRVGSGNVFLLLGEVGFTREGSDFAQGTGQAECIVTGGLGSMAVEYEGRTYYVCCSGCRELFEADPAGIIADYKRRQEEGSDH